MKNKLFFLVFFLLGMLFLGTVQAQNVIEKSSEITNIGGKEYYLHHVKFGETLYGISKVYKVSITEIETLNPEVKNGLKAGHVLGIPVQHNERDKEKAEEPKVQVEKPAEEPEVQVERPIEESETEVVEEPTKEPDAQVIKEPTEKQTHVAKEVKPNLTITVARGEDLYDIAKRFGIDIAEFKAVNQGLTNEPAPGTIIRIPNVANENDYIVHRCEKNERVSSLLKRWKVDEGEFRLKNISVGSHVFENQVVLIPIEPVTDFYWVVDDSVTIIEDVEEEEDTPSSEEHFEEPPVVFEDDFEEEERCVADPENASRRYKVALMVPLYLYEVENLEMSKENLPKLQKARSLSFIQFYEGFMMAVESLKNNKGLKLDLTVIDVTDNVSSAERALSQIRDEDFDMFVGPFFGKSFAVIEEYAKANNIVMVNPLSKRGSVIEGNPNVVKVKPGMVGQILAISNLVKNLYNDSNVFIVSREKSTDSVFLNQLEHHLNLAVNEEVMVPGDAFLQFARNESERLEMGNRMVPTVDVEGQVYSVDDFQSGATDKVVLANPVKRYAFSNISSVKSHLSGVRNNVIVAYGDDNVFATQILNTLAKETDRYPITLVAAPDWDKFEKLLVDNLLQMNAIFINDVFVDYSREDVKQFVSRFRQKYVVEPQSYAFEGYDVAMFFLSALQLYGDDMMNCLNCCDVPLLSTHYRFFNRSYQNQGKGNGRENQYWSLYQYDKELIELRPIDPFKKMKNE